MTQQVPGRHRPAAVALILVAVMITLVVGAAVAYRTLGGCASGGDAGPAAPAGPPGDADRTAAAALTTAGLPVTPAWSVAVTGRGLAAAAATGDTVLLLDRGADGSVLRAHDPSTGVARWQRTAPGLGSTGIVLAQQGVAVVTGGARDGSGELAGLRETDGQVLWCAGLSAGAPGLVDVLGDGADTVVLVERAGGTATVTALGTADGRQRWRTEVPARGDGAPVLSPGAGGVVALPGDTGLVALDLATGAERWRTPSPGSSGSPEDPRPLLGVPGRVVAATAAGAAGLSAADGTEAWSVATDGALRAPGFGWVDGDLAVLDRSTSAQPRSGLLARRLSDGTPGWQLNWADVGVAAPAGTPATAAAGGRRLVADGATVVVLDPATGAAGSGRLPGAVDALAADPAGGVLVTATAERVTVYTAPGR
ncbi:outer membrane protein assembly factor BamB family protein [Pseudonocardia bannensis]|uniref:PQQ-binding-like beta-propeller repeat protein n=1 Tax=Pseudonocardia bannensis TaxID=630973 RepID=A0A848DK31_9PSEU|nr:PQQ-binding-like beta-propeller repeat protein [Pseudonocardia bannensis]NMH92794.1 PQQ-binding-like beta-propeller repeat protein [Pseudonocardia bannensis]